MAQSAANRWVHDKMIDQYVLHAILPLQKNLKISCKCLILLRPKAQKGEKSGFGVELGG
jgi:hypothetical protein